ncbi:MAG: hypothetical protein OHK0022_20240 [Roseiflexaceae bacterium]
MLRKGVSALIALVLFGSVAINASASPLNSLPVQNRYTVSAGKAADAEPAAVPALAGAFALGVASSLVANAAYDYAKSQNWVWAEAPIVTDTRAESIFNY